MARFSLLSYYIIKCHSECVSTNERPGQPSWFFNQPEKHRKCEKFTTDGRTTDRRTTDNA